MKDQSIALIGHGTVGRALYAQLKELPGYNVTGIAVKHPEKHKGHAPIQLLTTDAIELIKRPGNGIILEAINDEQASLAYAKQALAAGKTYITASKKMVAENFATLRHYEAMNGGKLLCEAAVAGAIPVLRTLNDHLRGESITRLRGILNGTCNYILTRMHVAQLSFDKALAEAQDLGFAESEPASDVDAYDSYYKAIILAYSLSSSGLQLSRVVFEGIRQVSLDEVGAASAKSNKIKLVAEIVKQGDKISIDIRPRLIDASDPLYHVDYELNAITIEGARTGMLVLQGAGAGGHPTASAMVGDLLNAPYAELRSLKRVLAQMKI